MAAYSVFISSWAYARRPGVRVGHWPQDNRNPPRPLEELEKEVLGVVNGLRAGLPRVFL